MKKILHSGRFLDYDGNTITVTFYEEKHLWVSRTSITSSGAGGVYDIDVWSDAGDAEIYITQQYDWLKCEFVSRTINRDGIPVYKYRFTVSSNDGVLIGSYRTAQFNVGVVITDVGQFEGYDNTTLSKTITITRR